MNQKLYTLIINPNSDSEWKNNMYKLFKNEITREYTSISDIKFDGKVYFRYDKFGKVLVETRPKIKDVVKNAEEEVGVKSVVEKFKLKYPDTPYVNLIIEDKSYWVDIAIESVRKNIKNHMLSQDDIDRYFISMIEHINEIRNDMRRKKSEEMFKRLDPVVVIPKDTDEISKNIDSFNKLSSRNGCMLLLPLFLGICTTLYYIIGKFLI